MKISGERLGLVLGLAIIGIMLSFLVLLALAANGVVLVYGASYIGFGGLVIFILMMMIFYLAWKGKLQL